MTLNCFYCGKKFEMQNKYYRYALKRNQKRFFCDCSCSAKGKLRPPKKNIDNESLIIRRLRQNEKRRLKRIKEKQYLKKQNLTNFTEKIDLPIGLMA